MVIYQKARLERYEDAYDVDYQIIMAANDSDDKKGIDKKQLLLEAKINTQIGNSNMTICKKLIKICPECLKAYVMLRTEALKNGKTVEVDEENEEDEANFLLKAFNDAEMSDEEFESRLAEEGQNSKAFIRLKNRVSRLS